MLPFSPLVQPYVRFSRIRLSDILHRKAFTGLSPLGAQASQSHEFQGRVDTMPEYPARALTGLCHHSVESAGDVEVAKRAQIEPPARSLRSTGAL